MLHRAYTTLEIKSFDEDERVIVGFASTPTPDRGDDVLESKGAQFQLPMPFLWQHKHGEPLGEVFAADVRPDGIEIKARIVKVTEPGRLKDRLDEAWGSIKHKLVRGLSIGWRPVEFKPIPGTFGIHATKWLWHETSAVTIPMNAEATITSVKAYDADHLAALGTGDGSQQAHTPGAAGTPVVRLLPTRLEHAMKTIAEQISSYKSTRDQKFQEQQALMTKAAEAGVTLDAAESEQYDTLDTEVKALDAHIRRLEALQEQQKSAAVPAAGATAELAAHARGGAAPVIMVKDNLPPGIGFARLAMAKAVSRMDHRYVVDVVKEMFPYDARLLAHVQQKANVPAGSTTNTVYAAALVDPTNLVNEFIEYLRPATILGKFGTNGIPSLRRVPFNIRVVGQTTGGTGYWVGEGKPKPVTSFEFAPTTLGYTKVAAIAVITQELARFSSPSAETLVRDALRDTLVERLDIDLIDPAQAAVANVNPASLTNGLTALSSAGTSADNVRTDIQNLLEGFLAANQRVGGLVIIMPETLALALSLLVNDLGQREFPDITITGGRLLGIPVITSQYAANASGSGNLVIAVNTSEVFLADDGEVTVDMSTEASLQMLDNPTNDTVTPTPTTMVSLWQTNSIGLKAERFVNWAKRRATAVVYMDDVNWGAIGSPA
jgi:HK97 family phage major capsid protein